MTTDAILSIDTGTGTRRLRLFDYLDASGEEAAALDEYMWIKALRHARVGGQALRERFTYRGDSLWWFAELYLHKERVILTLFRALRATEGLIEREQPLAIGFARCDQVVRTAVSAAAAARRIRCARPHRSRFRLAAMDARSAALAMAAMASRMRPAMRPQPTPTTVAAFIHRAFWTETADDGSAESYIGPVLQALETRLDQGCIRYVGVGPSTNFRARRWWRVSSASGRRVVPIERLVPRRVLSGAWQIWRSRHAVRRELAASDDIRCASVLRGCDCWPIVREMLDGIALLQYPWSARAMDEAGAALDVLTPRVVITYAEAGGWGRALALESRRRGIPLVGLQHGFIYRRWLNYKHEADEMTAPGRGSLDEGFPLPALTLVYDEYAAQHLSEAGRFPRDAVVVTGSPRLDALAAEAAALSAQAVEAVRAAAGAQPGEPIALIVSKYTEIGRFLPGLLAALRTLPNVRVAIKTHPAETSEPYEAAAVESRNVRVLPANARLGLLLRAAQVVITVNSTVAIDCLALGVPAVAIGVPNNLSPFVEAAAMAGVAAEHEIEPTLRRVLYDQEFRQQLRAAAAAVAARYRIAPDGRAAERAASAILAMAAARGPEEGRRESRVSAG